MKTQLLVDKVSVMLRRATNCELYASRIRIPLRKRIFKKPEQRVFVSLRVGQKIHRVRAMLESEWNELRRQEYPYRVIKVDHRNYWYVNYEIWWEDDNINAEDVHALLIMKKKATERKINRAKAIIAKGDVVAPSGRRGIPDDVKQFVFVRDGGKCQHCGRTSDLQFDHIIPIALGGSSEEENLQVLCAGCNQRKGANLGDG